LDCLFCVLFLFQKVNIMKFLNKIVVITGTGKGIGQALALAYASEGAIVICIDKNEAGLSQTKSMIEAKGGKVYSFVVDLVDVEAIERTFSEVDNILGKVDILINNAGLGITKSIFDLSVEEWDYVINTNLRGAFLCSREAARSMKGHGGGSIVNIASTRALMSEADTFPYSASKGGIVALTHSLAVSLGPDHIRVNAISPGWIATADYDQLSKTDHAQHPAGRVGVPKDIIRACFYLTDPENDFVTGINLVVDGGMTKKMIYSE
jgi:NAD(P)-dependent dehydrogenase (short-subunit alcohol dehydrogenase family)